MSPPPHYPPHDPPHDPPHYPPTGLPDQAFFVGRTQQVLGPSRRYAGSCAVLAVQIDHFKDADDEYGHEVGDEVLVAMAGRLRAAVRESDTVALSDTAGTPGHASEFLVLCQNLADTAGAAVVADRILDSIAAPLCVAGRELNLTGSAGIAVVSPTAVEAENLVIEAEQALRQATERGGASHEFATVVGPAVGQGAAALDEQLRLALENAEFRLVYQPKVSLSTDRVVGVEALLRWDHPQRGRIPPVEFIPRAEATGLIVEIGAWVLREACRQGAMWHRSFPRPPPLKVSINVSPRQFNSQLLETVRAAIADSSIDPSGVCLEVTESMVMDNVGFALTVLKALKELGLTVSIDDFGTGYSSLAYLQRLPLDELKIDKSFVDGIGIDTGATAIAAAVVSLAHAVGHDVVAEGVETFDQLEKLRSIGCNFAQGYLLAKPMSAAAISDLLAAERAGTRLGRRDSHSSVAPGSSPGSETVLIADDANDFRQLARMSLTTAGFGVQEAADGASTIALARKLRPDCVLLDIGMDDMTGIEVCKALREDPATGACTIVMLTIRTEAADKVAAFAAGADDYILKPVAPRDLVARVRGALRRRQLGEAD